MRSLFVLIILILSGTVVGKDLSIFMGESSNAPYHIHASARLLSTVNAAVVGQLLQSDEGFNLKPGAVDYFHYDFKDKVYILRLKKDLVFHNGRTANSTDLEFTLTRGFYSPDHSFFRVYLGNISGIDSIKPGQKFKSGMVSGIKIIDNLTVSVKLNTPNPSFFHSLTVPYFSLVPIEEFKDDYLTWKKWPIGTGKYKVMAPGFDGEKTVLEIVNHENIEANQPTRVIIYSDSKKKVDISTSEGQVAKSVKYRSELPASISLLTFSNQHPLSKNINFKKGINHLLNRSIFEDKERGYEPVSQILPKHFWGRSEDFDLYNLNKAKEYFSKIPRSLLDQEYELQIFSGKGLNDNQIKYTDELVKQFKLVSFKAVFVANSEKFETIDTAKRSPIFAWNIVCDYVDPLIMFSAFKRKGHSPYYGPEGETLDKYEQLYTEAAKATDFDMRNATVKKLSKYVKDEAAVIPVFQQLMIYNVDSERVKTLGKQTNPVTLFVENIRMK